MSRIGIIGGSGLYQIEGIQNVRQVDVDTPFGKPSDSFVIGQLGGREIVFLPRHGRGHTLLPTEVNYRANIFALKKLGVCWIISISAVGSLRKDYIPTDVVIIDQFFDRTNQARSNTFFGEGIVAHVQLAFPLCEDMRLSLIKAGGEISANMKERGTYVNMEGPQFSTLAESQTYRQWGMDVIGMTQMSEARLAREAEMCYATVAMVTDFDCWHEVETGQTVSVDMILQYLEKNTKTAKELIKKVLPLLPEKQNCHCSKALEGAIITERSFWPQKTIEKLDPIISKYV